MPTRSKALASKTELFRRLARRAGLRYVTDGNPGISRRRAGKGFRYHRPGTRPVSSEDRHRIQLLAIPPAWRDVWICPIQDGHLQATGFDSRCRKQYRYHPRWRHVVNSAKFDRLLEIGRILPKIRGRIARQLSAPGLTKERVCAVICRLLDRTAVRVGNREYLRDNETHGLTTLLDNQVTIEGSTIHLSFRGKSGIDHEISVVDRVAAPLVQQCRAVRGEFVFQYQAEDGFRPITSTDVNAYLSEISDGLMTAKDFRTWRGTVWAAALLARAGTVSSDREAKRVLMDALRQTAAMLGNTVTVCRSYYVHTGIIDCFLAGRYAAVIERCPNGRCRSLSGEERLVAHLLTSLAKSSRR